ncbi:LysR family transcriptional regulator [Mesorhizobium sp. M0862]|uniref:LysR family transcriptional regulator n=1 Tax=Mesorhizobium sp. M0862 TaxID=2957015 RepID=UPI00333BD50D
MPRPEINRSGEMEVFVSVVDLGGLSPAARANRVTPSGVSKLISRLEARIGARLLNRSTRKVQLTPEGRVFYDRCVGILSDIDEAEGCVGVGQTPSGRLSVSASRPIGTHILLPLVSEFLSRNPKVTVELLLTDDIGDIREERTDLTVTSGPMKSSHTDARKLGETGMIIVGAPSYLESFGTPKTPEDLERHNRLGLAHIRPVEGWPLLKGAEKICVPLVGNARIGDGESLRKLVIGGLGLARLAGFQVKRDIEAGRLVPVLEDLNPGDREEIQAVYAGEGGNLPVRVRAFLDFLDEKVSIS